MKIGSKKISAALVQYQKYRGLTWRAIVIELLVTLFLFFGIQSRFAVWGFKDYHDMVTALTVTLMQLFLIGFLNEMPESKEC